MKSPDPREPRNDENGASGINLDDPFGSRPDEKPPAGWDAAFWNGVRRRIEERRGLPGSDEPPAPSGNGRGAVVAVLVGASLLAAGLVLGEPSRRPAPARASVHNTLVQVEGTADPDVSVEWARRQGRRAGYVVVESLDPQLSCILIDPPERTR